MLNSQTIRSILIDRAVQGESISYSELLKEAGFAFSRPKVRTLCQLLGEIDQESLECGEPSLAALVVRASDRLPGHGWWESRTRYTGPRSGPEATEYVKRLQKKSFQYWRSEQNGSRPG